MRLSQDSLVREREILLFIESCCIFSQDSVCRLQAGDSKSQCFAEHAVIRSSNPHRVGGLNLRRERLLPLPRKVQGAGAEAEGAGDDGRDCHRDTTG